MDPATVLKISVFLRARNEQQAAHAAKQAKLKGIHGDEKSTTEEGSGSSVSDGNVSGAAGQERLSHDPRALLQVSGVSAVRDLDLRVPIVTSKIEGFTRAGEIANRRAIDLDRSPDEASSSHPTKGIHSWDARKSAERFARLREDILRKYYPHDVFPVKELRGERSLQQSQKELEESQQREVQPAFVFTAGNNWRIAGSSITLGSWWQSIKREKDNMRKDNPYVTRNTSRPRFGGKASVGHVHSKLRGTSEFLHSTPTRTSPSLKNFSTGESPERTKFECVQILRNMLASQKPQEEDRKPARQHSVAEGAHFSCTAELQMIGGRCSLSNLATEPWEYFKSLFFCGRKTSYHRAAPTSPGESVTTEEEVTSSGGIEACQLFSSEMSEIQETAEIEPNFVVDLERPVNLPVFPDLVRRQRLDNRVRRTMSCDFELEKAMAIRILKTNG